MIRIALFSYALASLTFLYYERRIASGDVAEKAGRAGLALLVLGALLQLADLVLGAVEAPRMMASHASVLNALCLGWVVIGIVFAAQLRVPLLGVVIAPLATVMALEVAVAAMRPPALPRAAGLLEGLGIVAHAFLGYAGYASFFAAALGAALYLLQDRELRRKRLGPLFEYLPPLARSTSIMKRGVAAGVPLLAAAALTAMALLRDESRRAELAADPAIRTLFAVWLFAVLVMGLGRWHGWTRRRQAALVFLLGLIVIGFQTLLIFGGTFHSFSGN